MSLLPSRFPLGDLRFEPSPTRVEYKEEAGCECRMEIKRVPRHPVVAVEDVGVGVVPGPVHEFDCRDVVGDVDEHHEQADGERLGVAGQVQSGYGVRCLIHECGVCGQLLKLVFSPGVINFTVVCVFF